MSKSKKKNKAHSPVMRGVNTLGIDIESVELQPETAAGLTEAETDAPVGFELPVDDPAFYSEAQSLPLAEKIINYATLSLSMLLLGGSLVFWWVIGKHLIATPAALADAGQMSAILLACAVLPIPVTIAQVILRRPLSIERWLICMCISGAAAAMLVVIYLMGFRGDDFGFADYFTLLCCTVSGATLPSALCMAVRWLVPVIAARLSSARDARADENWDDLSEDVCSMTDFDL